MALYADGGLKIDGGTLNFIAGASTGARGSSIGIQADGGPGTWVVNGGTTVAVGDTFAVMRATSHAPTINNGMTVKGSLSKDGSNPSDVRFYMNTYMVGSANARYVKFSGGSGSTGETGEPEIPGEPGEPEELAEPEDLVEAVVEAAPPLMTVLPAHLTVPCPTITREEQRLSIM